MKQGSGNSKPGDQKVEPKPKGINPGWVGQIGLSQGTHVMDHNEVHGAFEKMHKDRGYKAPKAGTDSHHSGSQGRHK